MYEYCKQNQLLRNEYRTWKDEQGEYLEVRAGTRNFLCDKEDLETVDLYTWKYHKDNNVIYAHSTNEDKKVTLAFHRVILGLRNPKLFVIHLDRDRLNNRRENLHVIGSKTLR